MKANKAHVMVNKHTGKRLTLRETKELKKNGTYDKTVVTLAQFNSMQNRMKQAKENKAKKVAEKNAQRRAEKRVRRRRKYDRGIDKKISRHVTQPAISAKSLTNNDGDILYDVEGIHSWGIGKLEPRHNKYHFKVTEKTRGLELLQIGILASVETKRGMQRIMVTNITKPRSESKKEQARKYNDVGAIYQTTWVNSVTELEKDGEIDTSSRFFGKEIDDYVNDYQQNYREKEQSLDSKAK